MKKTNNNLIFLCVVFGITLVIANVVTSKLVDTGLTLFGRPILLPGAALCYAITYLCTDIIGEIWGKKEANACVIFGLFGQIIATILILFTQYLPSADLEMQNSYEMLLGQNWVFVVGSLVAYLLSQLCDVKIFHTIREKSIQKHNHNNYRWLWNNISTLVSQIVDTVVFILISFGLGFGWLFDSSMWSTLLVMMLGQYLLKSLLALLDTPIFYLLTKTK